MDFMPFSKPKFFLEILIEYGAEYFSVNTPRLFDRVLRPFLTSIGIMPFSV